MTMNTAIEVIANAHSAFGDIACRVPLASGATASGTPADSPANCSLRA